LLERLGGAIARYRWAILAGSLVAVALSGLSGLGIHSRLIDGGLEAPDAQSVVGDQFIQEHFPAGAPNILLLFTPKEGTVDDPENSEFGRELTRRLADEPAISGADSYWTLGFNVLKGENGASALIIGRVDSDPNTIVDKTAPIVDEYTIENDDFTVNVGGSAAIIESAARNTQRDYVRAELIAIPITIVLLLLVYRSLAAALLPAVVGGFAVIGTYPVLRLFSGLTDVTVFSLNIVTALGLALGIDYSLFIVSRYREELGRGATPFDAVRTTVSRAGRTIAFSACAVAASLAALFVFPGPFLRSFAIAGIAVVALAAVGAVVILPALLAVLGRRVEWGTLPFLRRRSEGLGWYRTAMAVMRRPLLVTVAVVVLLLLVGVPFLRIKLGIPDWRALPEDDSAAAVSEKVSEQYESREGEALSVAMIGVDFDASEDREKVLKFQREVSELPGVARVDGAWIETQADEVGGLIPFGFLSDGEPLNVLDFIDQETLGFTPELSADEAAVRLEEVLSEFEALFVVDDASWFRVVLDEAPSAGASLEAVEAIRDLEPPFEVFVTGQAAQAVDARSAHLDRLPLALALIAAITFLVLFAMFGSLLVPVKAILMNVLSLSATFGTLVWIFQDGHLGFLLDFQTSGTLYVAVPVLLFCVAFGTSMDYEVFMLSRIKEEYERTGDNEIAIATGIQRSARIVTAAAITFAAVMFSIGTSQLSFIKLLGVGLGIAILIDAFVIRVTLLPAIMRLAGDANWWAPRWLRRVRTGLGLHRLEEREEAQAESSSSTRVP